MTPVEAQPVRVQPRDVHPGDAALKGDSALQTPRPQMAVAAATRPVQLVNTAKVMKSSRSFTEIGTRNSQNSKTIL